MDAMEEEAGKSYYGSSSTSGRSKTFPSNIALSMGCNYDREGELIQYS